MGTIVEGFIFADPALGNGGDDAPALQRFLDQIEATGRIGVIPLGVFNVYTPLLLPITGRVMGSGQLHTTIKARGDNEAFIVKDGARYVELSHLAVEGAEQVTRAGIRFDYGDHNCVDCYFHDLVFTDVWGGIRAQPEDLNPLSLGDSTTLERPSRHHHLVKTVIMAARFERIIVKSRGYALILRRSVACRVRDFGSDHVGDTQQSQLRDIWIDGESELGGGCYLEDVHSQFPRDNGIVIENFREVWARHITGDNAYVRGIWIKNCGKVFLSDCFANLGGRAGVPPPFAPNEVGYSMVIENDRSDSNVNGQITLDHCHLGQAVSDGLYLRQVSNVAITNCTFDRNRGYGVVIDACEHVSVSNSLFQGIDDGGFSSLGAMKVDNSRFCALIGNQVSRLNTGFNVVHSTDVVITGNSLRGNDTENPMSFGIWLQGGSWACTITGNRVTGFFRGIYEPSGTGAHLNLIVGNNCAFNKFQISASGNGDVIANNLI